MRMSSKSDASAPASLLEILASGIAVIRFQLKQWQTGFRFIITVISVESNEDKGYGARQQVTVGTVLTLAREIASIGRGCAQSSARSYLLDLHGLRDRGGAAGSGGAGSGGHAEALGRGDGVHAECGDVMRV